MFAVLEASPDIELFQFILRSFEQSRILPVRVAKTSLQEHSIRNELGVQSVFYTDGKCSTLRSSYIQRAGKQGARSSLVSRASCGKKLDG